jgi:hypothetical protein
VSEQVYHYAQPFCLLEERGVIEIKNKKPIRMYFLNRLKPEFSADSAGLRCNERLLDLVKSQGPVARP